eukprot:Opistho-2@53172
MADASLPPIRLGALVEVRGGKKGIVRYSGTTLFAAGKWIGVELFDADGKNNGTVAGKKYFSCLENYGVFVRQSQLNVLEDDEDGNARRLAESLSRMPSDVSSSAEPDAEGDGPSAPSSAPASAAAAPEPKPSPKAVKAPSVAVGSPLTTAKPPMKPASSLQASGGTMSTASVVSSVATSAAAVTHAASAVTPPRDRRPADVTRDEADNSSGDKVSASAALTTSVVAGPSPARGASAADAAEMEALKEKIVTLEARRAEDREKLKEVDRLRMEVQRLEEYKQSWTQSQHDLQQRLLAATRTAKEMTEVAEAAKVEAQENADAAELATLDKEVAEEKAESMQLEIDNLKEKMEELQLDIEILKGERDEAGGVSVSVAPGEEAAGGVRLTSAEQRSLLANNERLKDALVKLRDATAAEKADLTRRVKELEMEAARGRDAIAAREKMVEEIRVLESDMADLTEQVDALSAAESMVATLSERSLDLEDRCRLLQDTVDDLEALKAVQEELEESHLETEREMQTALDDRDSTARALKTALDAALESSADYERTVLQYRDLVRALQSDLDSVRRANETKRSEVEELESRSQAVLNLNSQLQRTALKAHARAIEQDLRRLELSQAVAHARMLAEYVPEQFARNGDSDGLAMLLLLGRLSAKADIVSEHTRKQLVVTCADPSQRMPSSSPSPSSSEAAEASASFGLSVISSLARFKALVVRVEECLGRCDALLYSRVGAMHPSLRQFEKGLDALIDLLKREDLSVTCPVDFILKGIEVVGGIVRNELPTDGPAGPDACTSCEAAMHTASAANEWAAFDLARARSRALRVSSLSAAGQEKSTVETESLALLDAAIAEASATAELCRRSARKAAEVRNHLPRGMLVTQDASVAAAVASMSELSARTSSRASGIVSEASRFVPSAETDAPLSSDLDVRAFWDALFFRHCRQVVVGGLCGRIRVT